MKSKKGQLGIIEFKFFMFGLVAGLIVLAAVLLLGKLGVIPNFLGFLCK